MGGGRPGNAVQTLEPRSSAKSRYACEPPAIAAASDVPAQRKTPSQVAIISSPDTDSHECENLYLYLCPKKDSKVSKISSYFSLIF